MLLATLLRIPPETVFAFDSAVERSLYLPLCLALTQPQPIGHRHEIADSADSSSLDSTQMGADYSALKLLWGPSHPPTNPARYIEPCLAHLDLRALAAASDADRRSLAQVMRRLQEFVDSHPYRAGYWSVLSNGAEEPTARVLTEAARRQVRVLQRAIVA